MATTRDYANEYRLRIERGKALGRTRAQARGHPGIGEASARGQEPPIYDSRLEFGIRGMRERRSLTRMAHTLDVDPERLRAYAVQTGVVEKQRGRYVVVDDARIREVETYSGGAAHLVVLGGYAEALKWGRYRAAVGQFLDTNDPLVLLPFEDDVLTDVDGNAWPFETNPNALYRITLTSEDPTRLIYRIAVAK